jgi:hypothetical protein
MTSPTNTTVLVHIDSDPLTLGTDATEEDLEAYRAWVAVHLAEHLTTEGYNVEVEVKLDSIPSVSTERCN